MKRLSLIVLTMLTGVLIGACGNTTPTTTVPSTGAGTTTTSAGVPTVEADVTSEAGATAESDAAAEPTGDAMMEETAEADTSATAATRPTTGAGATSEASASTDGTIVDAAVADGRFTVLVSALQAAGLDQTLSEAGPFTVFAPTDEAFAALPAGTIEALLANPEQLETILTYHVASGDLMAEDIVVAPAVTTLQGEEIEIAADGGNVTLNGNAQVVITDIATSNGVIHVIDQVLLPPGVTLGS